MPAQPEQVGQAPEAGAPEDRASTVSRLFREHNRTLVRFLHSRLRNEQEAKELAQEAYVKLLQLEAPGGLSFLRSYLFRVAENLAIDRIRQRQIRGRLDHLDVFDDVLKDVSLERAAIAQQELTLLRQAVAELPSKPRQAFQLLKLQDRPCEEVAAEMRLTVRMVRKYVSRALIYVQLRREGMSGVEARARSKV
jgi:RNA polymerase sigma factor (sigma-70 family)